MSTPEADLSLFIPIIQTNPLAWKMRQNASGFAPLNQKYGQNDKEEYNEGDALHRALEHIRTVKEKGAVEERHLQTVEDIAWKSGLAPEDIDTLLDVALSGPFDLPILLQYLIPTAFGLVQHPADGPTQWVPNPTADHCWATAEAVKTRMLKCLIPATLIPESAVVRAFSRLCASNCSNNTKVLFFRWLIAMFDFIDGKEEMNSLYGFFFSFLQEETMSCYICNFLYLLTKRENVKPFRVRKLLEFQSKVGMQPYLQALLSLYRSFCPDLITISLPPKRKFYFKTTDSIWQAAVCIVKERNQKSPLPSVKLTIGTAYSHPQKKKWNSGCVIPMPTSSHVSKEEQDEEGDSSSLEVMLSGQKSFPLEQLHTFSQLLDNIQDVELPSQMCSVLKSAPLLHYLNCIQDETVWLRLSYWMSQELKEGCTWCKVSNYTSEEEFRKFLDIIISAQCFLQEGFPSSEVFLYKSLPLWDGISCRTEYLQLLSWIPLGNFSEIKPLLCDSLTQLFFTSSIYHKCSVLYSLKQLLENWLLWHAMKVSMKSTLSISADTPMIALNSVSELIYYVGWLSTIALRLEKNSSFLLHFILDFFEMVSDMYLNYNLPLVVIFPRGVFYPALLTSDSIALNRLCYIMYRYRVNLTASKENALIYQERLKFNKTYQEFNEYVTALVDCLWTSTSFEKDHYLYIDPQILEKTKIREYKKSLNLINHPALLPYSINFLLQGWPNEKELSLSSIQKKKWNWYLDYLLLEELHGLHLFMESSLDIADSASSAHTHPAHKTPKTCMSEPV
ncbi:centromere protein I isoform X2 [Phascolarctos cinereus]|uniref:Centromere protein I isoform X2 n=1 Tax=Phascolarctos cinereus TaxID=38626 RepID=A0A6P5ICZ1_PHACI|nr:centromere protein I isoform X2 [Phascolarctos cinereus]